MSRSNRLNSRKQSWILCHSLDLILRAAYALNACFTLADELHSRSATCGEPRTINLVQFAEFCLFPDASGLPSLTKLFCRIEERSAQTVKRGPKKADYCCCLSYGYPTGPQRSTPSLFGNSLKPTARARVCQKCSAYRSYQRADSSGESCGA